MNHPTIHGLLRPSLQGIEERWKEDMISQFSRSPTTLSDDNEKGDNILIISTLRKKGLRFLLYSSTTAFDDPPSPHIIPPLRCQPATTKKSIHTSSNTTPAAHPLPLPPPHPCSSHLLSSPGPSTSLFWFPLLSRLQ